MTIRDFFDAFNERIASMPEFSNHAKPMTMALFGQFVMTIQTVANEHLKDAPRV